VTFCEKTEMKYAAIMTSTLLAATIGCAQSRADGQTNAPTRESSGKPQLTVTETVTARVTSVADSTKMRMLVWVVTFQEKDGTLHKCLVLPKESFFVELGLDKLTYQQVADKKDYAGLPSYEIVIGAETKEYGKLISWKAIKEDAEPQGGGYSPPAARSPKPTP
jgi:hypothetical protein